MKFKKIILALSLIGIAPCLMNVSEPQEETTITMEDKDNNGVPDTIEDYYNEHIRDQYAFGIGLGSIIGFASSIVGVVVMVVKNGKSNKLIKESAAQNTEIIEKIKEEIRKKDELLEQQIAENKELVSKINEISTRNLNKITESANILKNYSSFETKLNAGLDCMKALGNSPENVKCGVSEEVNKIVGSVRNGEQK